jgi:hypothetical protein
LSDIGTPANSGPAVEGSSESALSDSGLNDFFSPEPTPAAPVAEGAPAQPAPGTPAAPVAPVPGAPPVPAPAPVPGPQGTPLAREDVDGLREAITQLAGAGKPAEAAPPPPNPLTDIPSYDIKLPDQLVEAMNSPDPAIRSQSLNAVISATMKTVHQQVYNQMKANIDAVVQYVPQMIEQHIQNSQTRQSVTTDFYGKYPQFDTPLLRPVVQLAFVEVIKAKPELAKAGKWTPELREAVGDYLKQHVPLGAQAPAAQPPKTPAAPPPVFGGGARPAAGPVLTGQEAEIASMFE